MDERPLPANPSSSPQPLAPSCYSGYRAAVEENFVEIPAVIIPNHAPATNSNKNLRRKSPIWVCETVTKLCPRKAQYSLESRNAGSSRPARSMVNSRGEFIGAHNPAVPHWSQIQPLAIRMMPFLLDVVACMRAACPSHVARRSSSTTIGFLPRRSMRGASIVVGEQMTWQSRPALPHQNFCDAASPQLQLSACCVTTTLANATAVMYVFD
jgi:hypothetical protein